MGSWEIMLEKDYSAIGGFEGIGTDYYTFDYWSSTNAHTSLVATIFFKKTTGGTAVANRPLEILPASQIDLETYEYRVTIGSTTPVILNKNQPSISLSQRLNTRTQLVKVERRKVNIPPSISGTDSNLGDKNLGFLITYQVDDIDTSDSLIVTERLNGSIIRTINGAPRNQQLEIEITNEKLFELELNSENTIEIKVDDGQGGIAYRRYTFRRTNSAPIISGQDEDLGQKTEPFTLDFSVSDNEGNAITVKTYLNNILKEEYQAEDGVLNTFTISKDDWIRLPIGQHSIKIEAADEHGATAVRNYTFTRYDDKIQFNLKNSIETDIMATKILVTPTWTIPEGAVVKVEACNNAFDENPTWEDITSQVLVSRHYNFTNDSKTSDEWGIDIRFTIEKGTSTEEVVINGFGGAFE